MPAYIIVLGFMVSAIIRGVIVGIIVTIIALLFTHLHIHSLVGDDRRGALFFLFICVSGFN